MTNIRSKKILLILTIIVNIAYIVWRIFFTIPKGQGIISLVFAMALLIVEIVGLIELFVNFFGLVKQEVPKLPEIDEDLFPEVDIFIATYNEPLILVRKTINACIHLHYPDKEKVNIFLCDDGKRNEMKDLAEKYGINYITREDNEGAKAGNLNNAMKYSSSPLIATLDADMIPMHDFLLATVPYFLKNEQCKKNGIKEINPKIGFVQTPQSFYNTDLFQYNLYSENRIPNEQDYFYRDIQSARNANNTVIYGGSNTVISRDALEEIGGFYTNSITEDFATGMLIQSKKYTCYALKEIHVSGLSPDDMRSLIKQRERWSRGCIQTARRVNLLFLKGLSIGQKISYFASVTYWYGSIKRFIYILCPILFSVFGIQILDCSLIEVIIFWLPSYVLTGYCLKEFSGNIRNTRWTNIYETILFPSLMFCVILETLCISKNKFNVTKKTRNQKDDSKYRLWLSLPFLILVTLSFIGIFNTLWYIISTESIENLVVLFWLIGNLFNLLMSLFFLLSRKQLRSFERFKASLDIKITQGNLNLKCKTADISEKGFSFILEDPIYINPDLSFITNISMSFDKGCYTSEFTAKIVQVIELGNKWKYACEIDEIKDNMLDSWYLIVHDRNPTHPETIEGSFGFYEDLEVNIQYRMKKITNYSRTTPRIDINYICDDGNGNKVNLIDFNYQFFALRKKINCQYNENIAVKINEKIILKAQKSDMLQSDEVQLYRLININEVLETVENKKALLMWLNECKVSKPSNNKNKKNENIIKELDLMEYV